MSDFILTASRLNKTYTQRSGRFGFGTSHIKALDDVSIKLRWRAVCYNCNPLTAARCCSKAATWPNSLARRCAMRGVTCRWYSRIRLLHSIRA